MGEPLAAVVEDSESADVEAGSLAGCVARVVGWRVLEGWRYWGVGDVGVPALRVLASSLGPLGTSEDEDSDTLPTVLVPSRRRRRCCRSRPTRPRRRHRARGPSSPSSYGQDARVPPGPSENEVRDGDIVVPAFAVRGRRPGRGPGLAGPAATASRRE